jgi:hypothetical protein
MTIRACLAAMLMVVTGTGCLQQGFDSHPVSGNGVPPGGSGPTTTNDFCGDGVCEGLFGETTGTCPSDCPVIPPPSGGTSSPPAPVCDTISLGVTVPIDLTDTTVGAEPAIDAASCGDGATVPTQSYTWIAFAAGVYTFSATADFPLVMDVQHGACDGTEAACDAAQATDAVTVTRVMQAHEEVQISLAGEGSATGNYELTIVRQPDACGDTVCEASETTDSCPTDCPAAPTGGDTGSTCGDGVCEAGESNATCSIDCADTSTPTGGGIDPTGPTDPCADGACDPPPDPCADGACDPPPDPCADGACDPTDPGDDGGDDGGSLNDPGDDGGDSGDSGDDGGDSGDSGDDGGGDDGGDFHSVKPDPHVGAHVVQSAHAHASTR